MSIVTQNPTKPNSQHHRHLWWLAIPILLFAFVLRIWNLSEVSLWLDEIFTHHRASAPDLFENIERTAQYATQTPLYYITVFPFPEDPAIVLRTPTLLTGILGIALLVGIVYRLYHRADFALLAGFLLAINPYHIWLSRSARAYPLVFVLSLLASYYFIRLFKKPHSTFHWLAFALTSMGAYLTHYFALGLPLAQYIFFAFFLKDHRGTFRRWIAVQFIVGLPVIAWLFFVKNSNNDQFVLGADWIQNVELMTIPVTFGNLTIGYENIFEWYFVPGLVAAAIGLVLGMYYAFVQRKEKPANFYWLLLATAPVIAVFLVSVVLQPFYVDRYFMVILPAVLVLMLLGWQRLNHRSLQVGLLLMVTFSAIGTIIDTIEDRQDEREGWRYAIAYIENRRQDDDNLLYRGVPLPIEFFLDENDPMLNEHWLNVEEITAQDSLPAGRTWVIYSNTRYGIHEQGVWKEFDPLNENNDLSHWLSTWQSHIVHRAEFNGITVFLLKSDSSGGEERVKNLENP